MKAKKFLFAWLTVLILGLVLSACSSGAKFPTGKFMDAQNNSLGYYLNQDKTWTYIYYGEHSAQGKYKVKDNLWVNQGDKDCPFSATYEWSFDGSNLSFKLVGEDQCQPRKEATDGRTFVLAE